MKHTRVFVFGVVLSGLLLAGYGIPANVHSTQAGNRLGQHAANAPVADAYTQAYKSEYNQILREEAINVSTAKYKKNGPYVVGYVAQGPINGWGKMFDVAVNYELKHSGQLKKLLYINGNGNASKQISGMEALTTQHPAIILLTPLSKAALAAPVQRAVAAGIPVVTGGGSVASTSVTAEAGRNLPQIAYQSAQRLAQMLHGTGNVVMFDGIAGSDSAEAWKAAAHAAFEQYPGIKIVAEQYANWSVAQATSEMQAILSAHPKIDGVWSGGSEMSIGAIEAFANAHKKTPVFGTTNPLNGFLRLAKQYHLRFYAAPYPPAAMAKVEVDIALKILHGQTVKRYTDVINVVPDVGGYTQQQIPSYYRSDLNDDFVPPAVVPTSVLLKAGFGR
jgi:ribose transport system substrate-binding protein